MDNTTDGHRGRRARLLLFPGDGFGFGYGLAVRTNPGEANPPPPGSIGELKWDSGSGTYFGIDPRLDMIYIMSRTIAPRRLADVFSVAGGVLRTGPGFIRPSI